ncbi:formyltetrahydrofolate deformylase [Arcticibacterium luteifluviistationis]|uniref:Formyltetrahydrofolate deformylase n=1 Tax=Arcticibacterium luteifluviistationis TaxID=1784714 RepID=A0A2Z4GGK9_9BACT|nr:formyltetrahydrofolate deformylase [Arcticibacterium luteifluviistationis]AWV99933.1 formyltetrahydrofolate deformylase [Arcticibacterium luteifluviistationis]
MTRNILLMEGPDSKGLVYHVTKVLYKNDCNIINQDEYVSPAGQFFMRTEFESEKKFDAEIVIADLRKRVPNEDVKFRLNPRKKKDIVILCTKEHHCLSDLLIRYHFEELNANILAVISNYDSLKPFVDKFDIPFHHVSHVGLSREDHELEIMKVVNGYQPEYLVLAKYMRILTPYFVAKFSNKIVNIHHSFLPAFIGANPYKQAFDRGVKIIGATAHFVNNNLDEGPIIAQDVKKVDHRFSSKDMSREGKDVEKMVLTKALKLVFSDRVFIFGNKTIIL